MLLFQLKKDDDLLYLTNRITCAFGHKEVGRCPASKGGTGVALRIARKLSLPVRRVTI